MTLPPPSPVRAWELGDAFLEGMSLLQSYPIETAGGVDRVLQTASDLAHRRAEEARSSKDQNPGLAAKLKVTMWKGFTNQVASPQLSPVVSDESDQEDSDSEHDGNKTETSGGLGSRLATTFWRGITNQSSMENPPSPVTPMSPEPLSSPTAEASLSPRNLSRGIWSYAEKLKDSDTAATLSKVSSNWKAKAMRSWSSAGSTSDGSSLALPEPRENQVRNSAPVFQDYHWNGSGAENGSGDDRRVSLPGIDRTGIYSPPARPAYFRQPRDTVIFNGDNRPNLGHISPDHSGGFISKTKSLQASFASLTRSQTPQPAPKTGPRPLLLSSSNLMSRGRSISRSTNSSPIPEQQRDAVKPRGHGLHDSMSSMSSMGSDTLSGRIRTRQNERSPDSSVSRRVPINRRSVLNMAPNSRIPSSVRHMSESSSGASDSGTQSPSAVLSEGVSQQGWTRVDMVESPPLSSPPRTPVTMSTLADNTIRVNESEQVRGFLVFPDPTVSPTVPSLHNRKIVRKKTPPPRYHGSDTSDSSAIAPPPRSPRVRSKRHPSRPTNLRLHDAPRKESAESLAVEWPEDPEPLLTPKASEFEPDTDLLRRRKSSTDEVARPRKLSSEGEARPRKVSTGSRTRKISAETKEAAKRIREIAAEEGVADDEGYDDLLSAYESEDSRIDFH